MFTMQAVIDFFQMDRRVPLGDITNTSNHHSGGVLKMQGSDLGPTLSGEGENVASGDLGVFLCLCLTSYE